MTTTAQAHHPTPAPAAGHDNATLHAVLDTARANTGQSLGELSDRAPTLVVLLRHTACPFCQEALADIRKQRGAIEAGGVQIALVHQAEQGPFIDQFFEKAGVADLPRFADPQRVIYQALDVKWGNMLQVFGPSAMIRAASVILRGLRPPTKLMGDIMQLPGTVLLHRRKVIARHVHRHQGDRPNYQTLAACPVPD